jgi:hypothetical protein
MKHILAHARPRTLVRNVDGGDRLEYFLLAAITTLLAVRFYIHLANNPMIAGGDLHIAHMLWGGLGMLIAIVLLLGFHGKRVQQWSAVIGGAGFGLFIDELGKFITKENDYLYRPAIALIYVIFVVLALVVRKIDRRRTLSPQEYLINALYLLEETVQHDLDIREKRRLLRLLRRCDQRDPLVVALRDAVKRAEIVPVRSPQLLTAILARLRRVHEAVVRQPWVPWATVAAFGGYTLFKIPEHTYAAVSDSNLSTSDFLTSFAGWGGVLSSIFSLVFIVLGGIEYGRSRLTAYQAWRTSILVSIFFSQFFLFYTEQLWAVTGLAVDLLILSALSQKIDAERRAAEETEEYDAAEAAVAAERVDDAVESQEHRPPERVLV